MATVIKYFIYARKSSEDDARQVLSLDSQEHELRTLASRHGLHIEAVFRESKSAKAPFNRPLFDEMLKRIESGEVQGVLAWKLDRLARNPVDEGRIRWLLQNGGLKEIKTMERDYRPEDNVLMASFEFGMANQYIRDLSKNVKRGLRSKLDMGWYPSRAPLGYLNTRNTLNKGGNEIIKDPERFDVVKQVFQLMLTDSWSAMEILKKVNGELGLTTRSTRKYIGLKPLSRAMIYHMLKNPFYYGYFDYGGQLYKGRHEPMITEAEYNRIQEQLGKKGRQRPKERRFDFTGLMICGSCGARITAEVKTRHYKNGKSQFFTYYHCTKRKDPNCTERTIEVGELNKQIDSIISTLSISDKFKEWAIKYLHELRTDEAASQSTGLVNKQKQLQRVVAQLQSLNLRYTAPENAQNEILSLEEYQGMKRDLLGQKEALEAALKTDGEL